MRELLISLAAAIAVAVVGFTFIYWCPMYSYINPPLLYLATVVGGGCCWIGLNLRKK